MPGKVVITAKHGEKDTARILQMQLQLKKLS
jgi:hypothetical protein